MSVSPLWMHDVIVDLESVSLCSVPLVGQVVISQPHKPCMILDTFFISKNVLTCFLLGDWGPLIHSAQQSGSTLFKYFSIYWIEKHCWSSDKIFQHLLVWDNRASAVVETGSVHHCHNPWMRMSLSKKSWGENFSLRTEWVWVKNPGVRTSQWEQNESE